MSAGPQGDDAAPEPMPADLLIELQDKVGRIRLNRPAALHALNLGMCTAMLDALAAWKNDDAVKAVMLDHADGRGFCAGGDIRMLADSSARDGAEGRAFFAAEYRLNHRLFTYPKPVIAFMDGIVMGGGVGIALPAKLRVATENTRFAMPETGIGLFPDVGGGWHLSRLPGRTGLFLALTGARLDGAECKALGIATHYLPAAALDEAKMRILADPSRAEGILGQLAIDPPEARILDNLPAINRLFAGEQLEDIWAALDADGSDWAIRELATLKTRAPLSSKVSIRLLAEGAKASDFAEEMAREYRVAARVLMTSDFREGVRAVLIDKDNAPQWQGKTPADVTQAQVDAIFAPLPPHEEWTPE